MNVCCTANNLELHLDCTLVLAYMSRTAQIHIRVPHITRFSTNGHVRMTEVKQTRQGWQAKLTRVISFKVNTSHCLPYLV